MPNNPLVSPLLTTPDVRRERVRKKVRDAVAAAFPIIGSRTSLEVNNLEVKPKIFSSRQQKQALLEGKSILEPIRGTVVLRDNATNKVLDSRMATLAHVPWFTPRNTFIVGGNEYSVSNQLRLRPGVYTRKRGNDDIEAQFNLSKGRNFKMRMAPETGVISAQLGTTNVPIYGVMKLLGANDAEIRGKLGSELLDVNAKAWNRGSTDRVLTIYKKLFPSKEVPSHDVAAREVKEYFANTRMNGDVNKITLGAPHDRVNSSALLDASKRIINVFKGTEEPDDRDNLQFKTIHQVDDLLAERVALDSRSLQRKLQQRLDHVNTNDVKKVITVAPFSKGIKGFLTSSSLARLPTQYNPIEIMDAAQRVTSLGEGGIENGRAVMMESRTVHPTHLGIIDPIVTAESPDLVGVDARVTYGAGKDDSGSLYSKVYNNKTNKLEYVPVHKLFGGTTIFSHQLSRAKAGKEVAALHKGKFTSIQAKSADYRVPQNFTVHGLVGNLLPFMNSMQGNRALMASKHITQALPLTVKESPYVQVATGSDRTAEQVFGASLVPRAPVAGVVDRIDDDFIYIRPTKPQVKTAAPGFIRVPYDTNFPLATKTYLHNTLSVKAGDTVSQGQHLGDSVLTQGGALAYGRNLNVALMAYKGANSNDGVVISEGAAKKLTSEHMYKEMLTPDPSTVVGTKLHQAQFGNTYTAEQYRKLTPGGVVRRGTKVNPGDILIAAVNKTTLNTGMSMLGKLHKSLARPFRDIAVTWDHDHQGEVIDTFVSPNRVVVTVKTRETMQLGDKLTGRHGNKGVVSMIIPDNKMPQSEDGNPLDVMITSAGVVSRINPSQVLEMAVGKVARKTGKPIAISGYSTRDNVKFARDLLKKNHLKDKETIFDPETNRKIPNIMVGPQYIMKLMKTTDTNYSARGVERYDVNQQPSKGGTTGAKGLGMMEFSALVAHGAKNVLKDAATIKGGRNDEYWQRVRRGLPPPPVKTSFAYDKFGSMLTAAGVKFDKTADAMHLSPLTDKDVLGMSGGAVQNPLLVRATDLKPEKGGLFDTGITGGLEGSKWGHISLKDRVVNPVFYEPVRRLLGINQRQLDDMNETGGGEKVRKALDSINVKQEKRRLHAAAKTLKGVHLDNAVKSYKYLDALDKLKMTPGQAYTLKNIPVIPPIMRPVIPDKSGNVMVNDTNYLYRDVVLANEAYGDAKNISPKEKYAAKKHLQDSVSALFGLRDPVSPQAAAKNARGFISLIAGNNPKTGYFQSKILSRRQDLSGRGTVIPDINLGMDEIGLPEDMAWATYEPFIVGRLVKKGYSAVEAKKMVDSKAYGARQELLKETAERPVIWNRAPSLHRFNFVASYPKLTAGKSLRIPSTWAEAGMAMDYDGDAVQIHVPVSPGAVTEAKKMTLPNLLFSDRVKSALLVKPQHEAIFGLYKLDAQGHKKKGKRVHVKGINEAIEAYKAGRIQANDTVI